MHWRKMCKSLINTYISKQIQRSIACYWGLFVCAEICGRVDDIKIGRLCLKLKQVINSLQHLAYLWISGIFFTRFYFNWFGPTHKNVKASFPIKPDIFRMISCYWMFLITQEWITHFPPSLQNCHYSTTKLSDIRNWPFPYMGIGTCNYI